MANFAWAGKGGGLERSNMTVPAVVGIPASHQKKRGAYMGLTARSSSSEMQQFRGTGVRVELRSGTSAPLICIQGCVPWQGVGVGWGKMPSGPVSALASELTPASVEVPTSIDPPQAKRGKVASVKARARMNLL